MTQKRGLGRGLGALIPGASTSTKGSPSESDTDPGEDQASTLRTRNHRRADPAPAESAANSRPVDMFFSGDPVGEEAERRERAEGGRDLAVSMARDAKERRAKSRSGSTGGTSARTGGTPRSTGGTSRSRSAGTAATSAAKKTARPAASSTSSPSAKSSGEDSTSAGAGSAAAATKSSGSSTKQAAPTTPKKSAGSAKSPAKASATKTTTKSRSTASENTAKAPKSSPKTAAPSRKSSATTKTTKDDTAAAPAPVPTATASVPATPAPTASVDAAPSPEPDVREEIGQVTGAERTAAGMVATGAVPNDVAEDADPVVDIEDVTPTPAHERNAREDLPADGDEDVDDDAGEDHGHQDRWDQETRADERELLPVPGAEFAEIPIHEVRENPRNPRTIFDDDALDELAFSLREVGVLQPVVVRPISATSAGESFELVMGERRWRAARRAGLETIPAIIRETRDDDLLRDALLENLHRSELNPLEEAAAYQQLLEDFGITQEELASRIGRSRPQISNTLRLMRLPALVQRRVASGALTAGHARALLSLDNVSVMEELAQRIVSEGLSVREVERLIAKGTEPAARKAPRRSTYNPRVVDLTSKLSNQLETPVRIDVGKRKGRITLEFTNLADLERVVDRLGVQQEDDD